MKTLCHLPTAARLDQSEAILESLQAGFFEAYFEKEMLTALCEPKTFKIVRMEFIHRGNQPTVCAKIVDLKGKERKVAERPVAADFFTRRHAGQAEESYSAEFSTSELQAIFSQPNCVGMRIMPGLAKTPDGGPKRTFIAVGVQEGGFDMAQGLGYLRSEFPKNGMVA